MQLHQYGKSTAIYYADIDNKYQQRVVILGWHDAPYIINYLKCNLKIDMSKISYVFSDNYLHQELAEGHPMTSVWIYKDHETK